MIENNDWMFEDEYEYEEEDVYYETAKIDNDGTYGTRFGGFLLAHSPELVKYINQYLEARKSI